MSSAAESDPELTPFTIDELRTLKLGTLRLLASQRSLPYRHDCLRSTLVALLEDWAKMFPSQTGADGETRSLNSSRPLEGQRWFQLPSAPQFSIFESRRSMFPSTGLLFLPVSEIVHVSFPTSSPSSDVPTISLRSVFVLRQLRRWSRGFGLVSPAGTSGTDDPSGDISVVGGKRKRAKVVALAAAAVDFDDIELSGSPVKWRVVVIGSEKGGSFGNAEGGAADAVENLSDRGILERIAIGFSDVGIPIVCVCVDEDYATETETAETKKDRPRPRGRRQRERRRVRRRRERESDHPPFDFFALLSVLLQTNCHPGGVMREGVLTPSTETCVAVCSRHPRSDPYGPRSLSARVHRSILLSGIQMRTLHPMKSDFWKKDWEKKLRTQPGEVLRRRWCDDCETWHEEKTREVRRLVWKEVVLGEKEELGEAVSGPFGVERKTTGSSPQQSEEERKTSSPATSLKKRSRSRRGGLPKFVAGDDVDVEEEEGELDLDEREANAPADDASEGTPGLPPFPLPTTQAFSENLDDFAQIRDEWTNFFGMGGGGTSVPFSDVDPVAVPASPESAVSAGSSSEDPGVPGDVDTDAGTSTKELPTDVFRFDARADSSAGGGGEGEQVGWFQPVPDLAFPPVESTVFDQVFPTLSLRILFTADFWMHPFMTFLKTVPANVEVGVRDSGGLAISAHSEALYRLPCFASFWDDVVYGPETETEGEGKEESTGGHFGDAVVQFVFPPAIDEFAAKAIVNFCYGDFHQCAACADPGKLLCAVHQLPFPEMELVLSTLVLLTDENVVDVFKKAVELELDMLANRCARLIRSKPELASVATLDQELILRVLRSPEFPVSEQDSAALPGKQISDFVKRMPKIGSLFDVEIHTVGSSAVLSSHLFSCLSPKIREFFRLAIPDARRVHQRPKPAYMLPLPSSMNILPYQMRGLCAIILEGGVPKDWPKEFACSILCAASDLEMSDFKKQLYRHLTPFANVASFQSDFVGLLVRVLQYCGYLDENPSSMEYTQTRCMSFLKSALMLWPPEKLVELLYVLHGPKKNLIRFQAIKEVPFEFRDPDKRQRKYVTSVKTTDSPTKQPSQEDVERHFAEV